LSIVCCPWCSNPVGDCEKKFCPVYFVVWCGVCFPIQGFPAAPQLVPHPAQSLLCRLPVVASWFPVGPVVALCWGDMKQRLGGDYFRRKPVSRALVFESQPPITRISRGLFTIGARCQTFIARPTGKYLYRRNLVHDAEIEMSGICI
jgi:hypothetical protein